MAKFPSTSLSLETAERLSDSEPFPSLAVRLYQAGTWSVVEVDGEMDVRVRHLLRPLPPGEGSHVVFDLRRVTFMDCSGVGVLAASSHQASKGRGSVRVVGASAQVRRLLTLTDVGRVVSMYDSFEEALTAPA